MPRPGLFPAVLLALAVFSACRREEPRGSTEGPPPPSSGGAAVRASSAPLPPSAPARVELSEHAMGTEIQIIGYTTPSLDQARSRAAMAAAVEEMKRLERLMSEWRPDSEVSRINQHAGEAVRVDGETFGVIQKALWASEISGGTFDISFAPLGEVWKFGDAAEHPPRLPAPAEVAARRARVGYRRIRLDAAASSVRIEPGMKLGLGGIAKGYIVDRASAVLQRAGLTSYLVRAGGDLYGHGKKPDGSPWLSGIQDPRGANGRYFATIELTDHAFSTAGDYARAYVLGGKRYHHIIDPRTGYPATACRSVTVWAPDAFIADAVDDAVFILGPKRGLELIEKLDGVGAVIVDAKNEVWTSRRLQGKVKILQPPSDGI